MAFLGPAVCFTQFLAANGAKEKSINCRLAA